MAAEPAVARDVARSTEEVVRDHLARRLAGDLDGDIATNYSTDVVMLSGRGATTGEAGVRFEADVLAKTVPDASFDITRLLASGPFAYIEWTARSDAGSVEDGADGFVVEDGRIACQTIHYTPPDQPAGRLPRHIDRPQGRA